MGGWVPLTDVAPAYDTTAGDRPAWRSTPQADTWYLAAARIPAWLGSVVRVRFVFTSDNNGWAEGAYLDDLRFDAETDDPDGDGLPGIFGEWLTYGTDPLVADTDGDGVSDAAEVADGTDPLNPSEWKDGAMLSPGTFLDFEADDGGLSPTGSIWEWGTPSSGPGHASSGSRVWATKLAGNYLQTRVSDLYLPPVDLRGQVNATLSFRLWSRCGGGDGLQVQAWDADKGLWVALSPDVPSYDGTDAANEPAWQTQGYLDNYRTVALSLAAFDDSVVKLRLHFTTDGGAVDVGAYVDDLAIDLESSDPDGDGAAGILGELQGPMVAEGVFSEPYVADTDGDGVSDGAEYAAGTDPSNPAESPSGPTLSVGDVLDFDSNDGGLATLGTTWAWGGVASGPGAGASGASAWATNLGGNYDINRLEYLYVPPLDLTTAAAPTFTFRLWMRGAGGDGVSLERFEPGVGWVPLASDQPAYDAVDASGAPAWRTQMGPNTYVWVGVSLATFVGQTVKLRFVLRTDNVWLDAGAYIDDVALMEEADDPDGDGLTGGLGELATWGTDPGLADTDGDGSSDGAEVAAGTDPLNPADYSAGPKLTPGTTLDFEADDGGLAAETGGTLWECGAPGSGPGAAWSGTQAWATNLSGNYGPNVRESVLLPPADLSATTRPTLGFRLWLTAAGGDGLGLEVQDADGAWVRLLPGTPAYDSTDALGVQAWRQQTGPGGYVQVLVDLSAWAGDTRRLRLVFRSGNAWEGAGAYIDDLSLDDETSDPDGDGLVGILDEFNTYGTDPYRADTDGDGVDDDVEIAGGTDPLNPADYPGGPTLTPGTTLDFEADDGGLTAEPGGTLWERGVPGSGPGVAWSGTNVWATNLLGNYWHNASEGVLLPPADLSGTARPTLGFRLWLDANGGDGLGLEVQDDSGAWVRLLPGTPDYESTDALGIQAWRDQTGPEGYVQVLADLSAWAGATRRLRLVFRSDDTDWLRPGAYIDDLSLDDETSDPDGDGLAGVLDEFNTYGTDPYRADTDGDGVDDGVEVGAGTDPLDPASL